MLGFKRNDRKLILQWVAGICFFIVLCIDNPDRGLRLGGIFLILVLILMVVAFLYDKISMSYYRSKGIYPLEGEATMDDVNRLISSGYEELAASAYKEVNGVDYDEAAVEVRKIIAENKG